MRQYFRLGGEPFLQALRRAGLGQADIVLCMMRINTRRSREIAEALIGRPITVAQACRLTWQSNTQRPTVRRQPVITWICPDVSIRRRTRLAAAFQEFRVGRTREQLMSRGVSRGDLRRAIRRGWIRMAGVDL